MQTYARILSGVRIFQDYKELFETETFRKFDEIIWAVLLLKREKIEKQSDLN